MAPIEPLPNRTVPWPPNILAAYQIIDECCTRAYNMLHQADMDPIRLRIQQEKLTSDVFPLLLVLEQVAHAEQIPQQWLLASAEATRDLVASLQEARENADGR